MCWLPCMAVGSDRPLETLEPARPDSHPSPARSTLPTQKHRERRCTFCGLPDTQPSPCPSYNHQPPASCFPTTWTTTSLLAEALPNRKSNRNRNRNSNRNSNSTSSMPSSRRHPPSPILNQRTQSRRCRKCLYSSWISPLTSRR
jgi:hypothetical protein